jgi:hypothetical protein
VATAVVLAAVEANPRQIAAAMRPALTFAADELARAGREGELGAFDRTEEHIGDG